VVSLAHAIHEHARRLSDLDGATGDGDHGINMDKGFGRATEIVGAGPVDLSEGLRVIGDVLITEIGGAMGPLYGSFFLEMASVARGSDTVDAALFGRMLAAGLAAVQDVGSAKEGDKTLLDALAPAEVAYLAATARGVPFAEALGLMAETAERGAESTRGMVARVGRASRLGERSRGSVDAGAASCAVILGSLADSMTALLSDG
jgi:dihydroxyacetone kinase-like protein